MSQAGVAVMVAVLVAGTVVVGAKPRVDEKNHFQLDAGSEWTLEDKGEPPTLAVLGHRSGGAVGVITRIDFPNMSAWRGQRHYFDDVIAGVREATPGFALIRQVRTRQQRLPVLELHYRRDHPVRPFVITRFLFWRTLTVVLTISSTRKLRRASAALASTFGRIERE